MFDHRLMTGGGEVFAELPGAVGRIAEHLAGTVFAGDELGGQRWAHLRGSGR